MKEEELRKAADEYTSSDKIRYIQDATDRDVEDAFVEGAEWALEHQWNDITKELPPFEVPVLVHRDDGIYLEMRYDKNKVFNPCLDEYGFDIDDKGFNNEARFWMSIPNLPDVNKK